MSRKSSKNLRERALKEPGYKKRVNSKVKGNRNELEVAKFLTRWTGVEFRRTPMSGAIHVPLEWLSGDVFCVDKDFNFPFSVEAKHYHKVRPSMVETWWEQTKTDAERINKKPLLFFREDGMSKNTWWVKSDKFGIAIIAYCNFRYALMSGAVIIMSDDLLKIPYNEFLNLIL